VQIASILKVVSFVIRVSSGASFDYTYRGRPCAWHKDMQPLSDCALKDSCYRMQVQAKAFLAIAYDNKDDFELLGSFILKGITSNAPWVEEAAAHSSRP